MVAVRRGYDPACRYSKQHEHACVRNNGEPVREGDYCFAETAAQLADQADVLRAAESVVA